MQENKKAVLLSVLYLLRNIPTYVENTVGEMYPEWAN